MPEVRHWALIASKGKSQVIKVVTDMRKSDLHLPGMPVFGLVDGDQGNSSLPDYVIPWPVAMMENLLLDEEAIYELVKLYPGVCSLNAPTAVRASLLELAVAQVEEERRLQLKGLLPQAVITIDTTDPAAIEAAINTTTSDYKGTIAKLELPSLQKRVDHEVQAIVDAGEQLERFHGKKLLRAWYNRYFAKSGMGLHPFMIQLAAYVRTTARTAKLTAIPLARIKLYFPKKIVPLLQTCPAEEARDGLVMECKEECELWQQGKPLGEQREQLRRKIVQYARESVRDETTKAALIKTAMEIGTP